MSTGTERRLMVACDVAIVASILLFGWLKPSPAVLVWFLMTVLLHQASRLLSIRAGRRCIESGQELMALMRQVHAAQLKSVGFEVRKCETCGKTHPVPIDDGDRPPPGAVH